ARAKTGIGCEDVLTPFPYVAEEIPKAARQRATGARVADDEAQVSSWSVEGASPSHLRRRRRGPLPFRFAWETMAGEAGEGLGLVPGDMRHGMAGHHGLEADERAAEPRSVCPSDPVEG